MPLSIACRRACMKSARKILPFPDRAARRTDELAFLPAALRHYKHDLIVAQLDAARLRAALTAKGDPIAAFIPPQDGPSDMVQMQRRLLVSQVTEQAAKIAGIDGQIAQKEAERGTLRASIDKIKAVIQPLEERVEIRKQMFNKELGSRLVYLTELQDLVGQRK